MKTIALSAQQRQEIQDRRRQADDRRVLQRLSAVLGIDEGRTRDEVAELLGVSRRQVGDRLRIFGNKGLDEWCTWHYRGDPGRLRPAQVERPRQEIAEGAYHNADQVRAWIEEPFGVAYSATGVKDLLHRIGAGYHKVSGFFLEGGPGEAGDRAKPGARRRPGSARCPASGPDTSVRTSPAGRRSGPACGPAAASAPPAGSDASAVS